ncbi:MAG: DUF3160 domain-containing protein [Aminivibrio sp.]
MPAAAKDALYVVTDIEVSLFSAPLDKIPDRDNAWEEERYYGHIVYGNHVRVRPIAGGEHGKYADRWYALLSGEDGDILCYVPKKGLEKVPVHKVFESKRYMVKEDSSGLWLQPDKEGGRSLYDYGYSLAAGEVLTAVGEMSAEAGGWLLFKFSTDARLGEGGLGARYAWGREADFTPLASYKPDNSRVDEALLPSKMRYSDWAHRFGDGQEEDDTYEKFIDFLPVTEPMRKALLKKGFYVEPSLPLDEYGIIVDDMADWYSASKDYQADFITTDMFLHAFHLIFDRMLQKFERTYLSPELEESMKIALMNLAPLKKACESAGAGDTWARARDMLSIPLALLEEKPGTRIKLTKNAAEEVKRILAAQGVEDSLVTGSQTDYTAFRPRGHYTISPELERYFRAMSWLGSAELTLFPTRTEIDLANVSLTGLISLLLDLQGKSWDAFEAPIDFLVGASNTGGTAVYRELAKRHLGILNKAPAALADEKILTALAEDIKKEVAGPLIQSVAGGDDSRNDLDDRLPVFRISGKRFTPDAYVMNMLTSPRVGTDDHPRNLPKGTDVMVALGSAAADEVAALDNAIKGYSDNLEKLKAWVDEHLAEEASVYTLWIKTLREGFKDSGADQFFYRSPAWRWKKLSTNSASWAELKHDTVLYAEQSGAEMGAGGWEAGPFAPPQPRGYIEPDPQLFDTLHGAVKRMSEFIAEFGMESEDEDFMEEGVPYSQKLQALSELLEAAGTIARKQIRGEILTDNDYDYIKVMAGAFDARLLLPGEHIPDSEQLKMALVTDVATDFFEGRVLHVASGRPQRIHVFVNDASAGPRITRGYIFSYYEFIRGMGDGRMTDEEWKEIVYDDSRAEEVKQFRPPWYEELYR